MKTKDETQEDGQVHSRAVIVARRASKRAKTKPTSYGAERRQIQGRRRTYTKLSFSSDGPGEAVLNLKLTGWDTKIKWVLKL